MRRIPEEAWLVQLFQAFVVGGASYLSVESRDRWNLLFAAVRPSSGFNDDLQAELAGRPSLFRGRLAAALATLRTSALEVQTFTIDAMENGHVLAFGLDGSAHPPGTRSSATTQPACSCASDSALGSLRHSQLQRSRRLD
ncbi:MAG: hypothetical protein R3F61_34100 [Myxococcota bacterium]